MRNLRLANVFYRPHLIETYGTGPMKSRECYAGSLRASLGQAAAPVAAKGSGVSRSSSFFEAATTATRWELQSVFGISAITAVATLRAQCEAAE